MHSLSVRSESPESVPVLDTMPAVVPELDGRRVGVRIGEGVRVVEVDHDEPEELCDGEELLCDDELDEREEL